MSASTTMTIRLTPEAKDRFGRLAAATHRSKSFLAAEAMERYLVREAEIIEGIEQGLDDMKAGRLVPHDEAMNRLGPQRFSSHSAICRCNSPSSRTWTATPRQPRPRQASSRWAPAISP